MQEYEETTKKASIKSQQPRLSHDCLPGGEGEGTGLNSILYRLARGHERWPADQRWKSRPFMDFVSDHELSGWVLPRMGRNPLQGTVWPQLPAVTSSRRERRFRSLLSQNSIVS